MTPICLQMIYQKFWLIRSCLVAFKNDNSTNINSTIFAWPQTLLMYVTHFYHRKFPLAFYAFTRKVCAAADAVVVAAGAAAARCYFVFCSATFAWLYDTKWLALYEFDTCTRIPSNSSRPNENKNMLVCAVAICKPSDHSNSSSVFRN